MRHLHTIDMQKEASGMKIKRKPLLCAARKIRLSFSLAAIVYLALGVLFLLAPNASRSMLCMLVSICVAAYGLFNILSFLIGRREKLMTPALFLGVCACAFGIFSIVNPTFLMDFLFTVVGVMVLVTGVAAVRRALALRAFGYPRWPLSLACSLLCIVFALSIVFFPALYGNALMMAVGLVLIIGAVSDLVSINRLNSYTQ